MHQINPREPLSSRQAWVVTLAGMGINLCLGVLYSWSVFAKAFINQLGWTKTAASWPYTLAIILFALIMVPAGRFTDKHGPRLVACVGGLFTGGGMILSGLTLKPDLLTLSFGLLVGTGLGLGFAAAITSAVKWFDPKRQGLVSGLVVSGFALASVYVAPLTNYLLRFGIQRAFLVEGIVFFIMILLFSRWLAFPPQEFRDKLLTEARQELNRFGSQREYDWRQMMGTSVFYILWIAYVLGTSAGLMIIGHISKIAEIQAGIDAGFILVALLAVANAGGRIISGWLGDRIGRRSILFLVFTLQAVNLAFFISYHSMSTLILGAVASGYSYGSLASLFPSITYEYFGTRHAGINYGLVFTAWGVGGVIGPIVAGLVADRTGDYSQAYWIAAALCIIAALMTPMMRQPKKV